MRILSFKCHQQVLDINFLMRLASVSGDFSIVALLMGVYVWIDWHEQICCHRSANIGRETSCNQQYSLLDSNDL